LSRNESGRFGALKSDSTHHFFRNACTKSGSLRFSQFSGCWLILSVYILMSSVILLLPLIVKRYGISVSQMTTIIHDLSLCFSGICVAQSLVFGVVLCISLGFSLLWPCMYSLPFCDLRLLINPLLSSTFHKTR
jgi:uncharacterized membrane protein